MTKRIKGGRRAPKEERDYAQRLVDEYRALAAAGAFSPEGAETADGGRIWANPSMLLQALERFAETGWLRPVESAKAWNQLAMALAYSGATGSKTARRGEVEDRFGVSDSTVKRRLRGERVKT